MYTVAIYHNSVPNGKNQEKIQLLRNFSAGVSSCGDRVIDIYNNMYYYSDVGVIQGWITDTSSRPHQHLRNEVINEQLTRNRYVVSADSNMFLYADTKNKAHYLRYSFNGIFPNKGIYCDDSPNPSRWAQISRDLNLSLKDYRINGQHILLCLQRNGGWSMGQYSVVDWVNNTIDSIRKYTDRPILIRPHPGDKKAAQLVSTIISIHASKGISISKPNTPLVEDLKNCWAAVNHNSSPVVGAAIEGIPIFVTDMNRSQCAEIANKDFSRIEAPTFYDRQAWVERLSMFHWNFQELMSGECWSHMRNYIR